MSGVPLPEPQPQASLSWNDVTQCARSASSYLTHLRGISRRWGYNLSSRHEEPCFDGARDPHVQKSIQQLRQ